MASFFCFFTIWLVMASYHMGLYRNVLYVICYKTIRVHLAALDESFLTANRIPNRVKFHFDVGTPRCTQALFAVQKVYCKQRC